MDKLKMQSMNKIDENILKIGKLFPNCITESKKGNELHKSIDFDILRQELSNVIVEGREERYQFTWPDKKKAVLLANSPINATLRPCKKESVDFDKTENLYIEGDNLDVLKCLKETYLGKIKMIYIDPPYNTGNDFVYNDEFEMSNEEWKNSSGNFDEEGNQLTGKLERNTENNGRFHTDWLNMIYPRLKVARDLLTEDGVIFISIDDNEVENLRKVCDEIFGELNFESCVTWRRRTNQPNDKSKMIAKVAENIIVYSKNADYLSNNKGFNGVPLSEERIAEYTNPDDDPNGPWSTNPWKAATGRGGTKYSITTPAGRVLTETWYGNEASFNQLLFEKRVHWTDNGNGVPRIKIYLSEAQKNGQAAINFFTCERYGSNQEGSAMLEELFGVKGLFDNPKPIRLLQSLAQLTSMEDSIILDFFSGSATTAHAVMQLNSEDGGKRKFIMVQLPEVTDEKSEAYKAGYKNICEIGKERIRRAGKKIKEELAAKQRENGLFAEQEEKQTLDTGFRVLKLDSSNMQDVYYAPSEYNQDNLFAKTDNVKPDRTPEDLLFQVMLELGATLDSKIEQTTVEDKTIFNVAEGYLFACFDSDISDEVVKAIAEKKPYYVVFRDSGMATDSVITNFEQIFSTISPTTVRKVL